MIDEDPQCFLKILDRLRMRARLAPGEPMPPLAVAADKQEQFSKVVTLYFPGQEAFIYGEEPPPQLAGGRAAAQAGREFVFEGVDNSVKDHGKFDQAGVLNHIGTAGGTREWANPCASGDVAVAWSSKAGGTEEENFVSKWDWKAELSYTEDQPNSWMRVDLGATRSLAVSHYALRHRGLGGYGLRSWELQGAIAPDGPWTTLRRHDNDASIEAQAGFVAAWAVEGAAPFRFFRIHQHGPNSSGHQYLMCAGIELYGLLTED